MDRYCGSAADDRGLFSAMGILSRSAEGIHGIFFGAEYLWASGEGLCIFRCHRYRPVPDSACLGQKGQYPGGRDGLRVRRQVVYLIYCLLSRYLSGTPGGYLPGGVGSRDRPDRQPSARPAGEGEGGKGEGAVIWLSSAKTGQGLSLDESCHGECAAGGQCPDDHDPDGAADRVDAGEPALEEPEDEQTA